MNNKRAILLSIVVILLGLIITAGSYAFWSWSSDSNKNVAFNTSKNLRNYIVYNEGDSKFSGDFKVGSNYQDNSIYSTISLYKTSEAANVTLVATIHMDINRIGENMKKSNALKWVVTKGNSTNPGETLAQGNFIGANNGDTLTLVPNIEVTTTNTEYTIWIWLDRNANPSDSLSGETLDTNVWTEINQIEGIEDRFEITRIGANYQNINATVVDSKSKVTHYAIVAKGTTPSSWTSVGTATNIYNLNTTVSEIGEYDVYFKDEQGRTTHKTANVTAIDNTPPTCTFGSWNITQISNNQTSNIELTCIDNESEITVNNLKTTDIVASNSNITISKINKTSITNGYKYTISVKGTENDGTTTLTLPAAKIKNAMALSNLQSEPSPIITVANQYTVKFATGNASCTLDSVTYADIEATYGTAFNVPIPSCLGYTFNGWTADSGLDTTKAKYGDSSSTVTTTWSNESDVVNATWFNDLALNSTKRVTLTANWTKSDNTAPTLTVTTPTTSNTYEKQRTATITISDNLMLKPGTYTIKYGWSTNTLTCNDLTDTTTISVISGETTKSTQVTISGETGAGTLYVCNVSPIYDIVDNILDANTVKSTQMYLDNVSPTGTLTLGTSGTKITATLSNLNDNLSGVATIKYYSVSDNSTCDNTISGFNESTNNPYTFPTNYELGMQYVCVKIKDNAGNETYISDSMEIKPYLRLLNNSSFFKENTYREKIVDVNFVNYIDFSNAISGKEPYILDENNLGFIKGWLEVNDSTNNTFDLYIGANNYDIYGKNFTNLFAGMSNASNFNFSALNVSEVTNMYAMFQNTGVNATDFNLNLGDKFDTSNVTNMASMFFNVARNTVTNLSINLGNNFNASNVTNMSSMFANAGYNAVNFNLNLGNNFNASKVTSMNFMFSGAGYNAVNFNLSLGNNFNTSKVTYMGYMFQRVGGNSVNFSLDLGDEFNTSNVTSMAHMFDDMAWYRPKNINFNLGDKFDTSNVISMSHMFNGFGGNSVNFSLNLGDKFNTSNVTDMSSMFGNVGRNSKDFSLNLGNNFDTSNVTDMSGMFFVYGSNITDFNLNLGNKFDTSNVTNMAGMFSFIGENSINFNLNLGDKFDTSNVTNMVSMFRDIATSKATNFSLNLGNKFNTSNVTKMEGMFWNIGKSATTFSLNLGDKFNTSNVTSMYYMFSGAGYKATNFSLNLGNNFNASNVTNMDSMFNGVGGNSVDFSLDLGNDFNASKVTDMYSMFANAGLSATNFSLNLGDKFDTSNVISMERMFWNTGKSATTFSLNLGNKFDISNVTNMDYMFTNFANKTTTPFILNLSAGNFSNVTKFTNMFLAFPFSKATIYVKDPDAQAWMIARSPTNFNVNNVIIYHLNYFLNGGEFADDVVYSMKGRNTSYTVPRPVRDNYTFAGWTGSNGDTPVLDLVIPAGTTDILKYYANWTPVEYTISYDYSGGSMVESKDTYDTTETFTLNIPYKDGYIFEGWTGSNGETPEMSVTVPEGTYGKLSYTAHYRTPVNEAERTLAKLHKLGGTAAISTTTGTTNGDCPAVDNDGNMTIASIDNSAGRLCNATDDYGTSLVFRGKVTDNYVKFGTLTASGKDMYWRIVRINGDGSLRLIYEGTFPYTNGTSSTDKAIGSYKYNALKTDNAYAGYMYGDIEHVTATGTTFTQTATATKYYVATKPTWDPVNGYYKLTGTGVKGSNLNSNYVGYYTMNQTKNNTTGVTFFKVTNVSTDATRVVTYDTYSRASQSLAEAQENVYNSTVKYYLDNWYNTKTNLPSLSSSITDTLFCNDRSISEFAADPTGMGYGATATNYRYYYGPWSTAPNVNQPNLKCINQNDRFTVSDETKGNGDLTYPIGLINEDEVIAAGGYNGNNTTYYLYSGNNYWTMSPVSLTTAKSVNASGHANTNTNYDTASYVRPVINIDVDSLLSGYGSSDIPFVTTSAAATTYLITYTLNNGTLDNPINSYTPSSATFTLNNPTRTGYTFAGWTGSNGDTPEVTVTIENGTYGNLAYTANWTANDYTVTLDSSTADNHGTTETIATFDSAMPDIAIPEKTDYAFVGYYTGENGTGTQYYTYQGRSATNWVIADDTTLYAYFVPKIITLDEQSPTTHGDTTVTAIYNEYLPTLSSTPTKEGYYFFGYYSEPSCSGSKYINNVGAGTMAWTATSPTTLYACWTEPQKPKDIWEDQVESTSGYLFSGASGTTYNYITFSNTSFRIIGLFDNRLKIIRTSSYANQKYNNTAGNNVWANTTLKTYLNGTFYNTLTEEAKSMISAYPFKVGACAVAIKAQPATECIATLTDSAIVGLMDIADYGMSSSTCKGGSYNINAYNTATCRNNSWLVMNEWTLTPVSGSTTNAIRKYGNNANSAAVTTSMAIRPVVYLNEDVYIIGGSGKSSDPYMLEIINE